ncbi:hypothetical protein TVAG_027080 [Trichomonas vaginalis G3]|uniref:Uncharacterized protein n=1 Tax=Trichomonas vaginalis (strain ATCC PRA-98 / G3) TaxID=412133 RepID=A2F1F3_TRIV3|nr:hypothetical protein TVAGG3_0947660 [Trichomonas vaginalis G3]EAY01240.1 hypothetical protein TVAG_027080 [Trichomonas vaginalis G3]KAI5486981.1 hypothetical protein TVAGG3_0947660 [Trichomonas vaginalis G3]|eukprot:XP_001314055.1 hypothetical protein [Trichomonas vaginalis G3]
MAVNLSHMRKAASSPNFTNVEVPLKQTQTTINNAIISGKDCIFTSQTKQSESQILIENAVALQSTANTFNESVSNLNMKRNHKLHEQLIETNNTLESTLSTFTDYSKTVSSNRSSTIKSILNGATSILPGIVFYVFDWVRS